MRVSFLSSPNHHNPTSSTISASYGLFALSTLCSLRFYAHKYLVNLYVGLWRKDFIEKTLPNESMSAWDFEVSLTAAARKANGNCAVSKGTEFPIMDTVRKGKILRSAHRYLKKQNLYKGARPIRGIRETVWLSVRTFGQETLLRGPKFLFPIVRKVMMALGMHSFSGEKKR